MQTLLWFPVAFYVLVMPILFFSWLGFFRQDREITSEERRISLLVIAIATLLWPVVIPFAYLELLDRLKRTTKTTRLYQKIAETHNSHVA